MGAKGELFLKVELKRYWFGFIDVKWYCPEVITQSEELSFKTQKRHPQCHMGQYDIPKLNFLW